MSNAKQTKKDGSPLATFEKISVSGTPEWVAKVKRHCKKKRVRIAVFARDLIDDAMRS